MWAWFDHLYNVGDVHGPTGACPDRGRDDLSTPKWLKFTPEERKAAREALKINNRWLAGAGHCH